MHRIQGETRPEGGRMREREERLSEAAKAAVRETKRTSEYRIDKIRGLRCKGVVCEHINRRW